MTNPEYTAVLLVLDSSGSMFLIKDEAQKAVNQFIAEQAAAPGRCTIKIVDFSSWDDYREVCPSMPAAEVRPYELVVRQNTALFDALARAVLEFGAELEAMPEQERPGKVVLRVVTDGQENNSREWTAPQVRGLIRHQQDVYGWLAIYEGANQDAAAVGADLGFDPDRCLTYDVDHVESASTASSSLVTRYRSGGSAVYTTAERSAAVSPRHSE